MAKTDYSTWLTKQQAADAIGVSTKTIEKLVDQKKLQQQYWKRPETGATVSVLHPDDVNRIRLERNPDAEPFLLPPDESGNGPAGETKALATIPPKGLLEGLMQMISQGAQNSQSGAGVPLADRLFLTLGEASRYSGLGETYLRRQIAEGALKPLKGAGFKGADVVRRVDLEKL